MLSTAEKFRVPHSDAGANFRFGEVRNDDSGNQLTRPRRRKRFRKREGALTRPRPISGVHGPLTKASPAREGAPMARAAGEVKSMRRRTFLGISSAMALRPALSFAGAARSPAGDVAA